MRKLLFTFALLSSLSASGDAAGRSRTMAILEYRAGVRAAPRISAGMSKIVGELTSHKVVSPAEARRRLGAVLDAEVAQCQGEAACIARIGGRLGCQEVILVGISQLGDLILAIQRIDVATGQVLSRLADSVKPRRRIRRQTLERYLRQLLPPEDFKRYGEVIIKSDEDGDEVYLDEFFRGKTPLAPLKVSAPARYTVRVKRPGHSDFVARLDVLPDAAVEVTPTLSRLSTPFKWYERWWVWAIVGGVVAGTATTIAAVSLSQGPDSVPAVVKLSP